MNLLLTFALHFALLVDNNLLHAYYSTNNELELFELHTDPIQCCMISTHCIIT